MIIGFTIAKNAVKEGYPVDKLLIQHKNLFDVIIIGVPIEDQDHDNTRGFIARVAYDYDIPFQFYELDWPGKGAWTRESLDKKLQLYLVTYIEETYQKSDWVIKIDCDEFYHEKDFDEIKSTMEFCDMAGINNISTNYRQFVKTTKQFIWDPTNKVFHIVKNRRKADFMGNDAMILSTPDQDSVYLEDVYLNHIGYVKDEERLTTKIREHIVLNKSHYPDIKIPDDWKFKFPTHKVGARAWPLGICELRGQPNETEYFDIQPELIPQILR